jgi:hypothetical protein
MTSADDDIKKDPRNAEFAGALVLMTDEETSAFSLGLTGDLREQKTIVRGLTKSSEPTAVFLFGMLWATNLSKLNTLLCMSRDIAAFYAVHKKNDKE